MKSQSDANSPEVTAWLTLVNYTIFYDYFSSNTPAWLAMCTGIETVRSVLQVWLLEKSRYDTGSSLSLHSSYHGPTQHVLNIIYISYTTSSGRHLSQVSLWTC